MSSPERRAQGLIGKFNVSRVDGTDAPGGRHFGCRYFVLDMTHDPHAAPALRVYARSCEAEYPALARDLRQAADELEKSLPPAAGVVHEAGELVEQVQRCRRCSAVLADYRGAMQLSSDPPLRGFPPGAFVETAGPGSWVTDASPTCGAAS